LLLDEPFTEEPLLDEPLFTPEDEVDEELEPSSSSSQSLSSVDAEPELLEAEFEPEPELVDADPLDDELLALFTPDPEPEVVGTPSPESSSSSQSPSSSALDSGADVVTGAGVEVAITLEVASVTALEVATGATEDEATIADVDAAGAEEEAGVALSVPSWMALACAEKVVETMGQPTPGPLRFCKVTAAALILASLESFESSVGNVSLTVGLLRTWPAATLADSSAMNASRSGGHWQGILIGLPSAPAIPSQSPVPVGFKPACKPKGGTKAGSTPLELDAAVADAIGADEATCTAVESAFVTVVAGALEEAATEVAAADEADETADTVDKAVAAEDEPSAPASIALACAEKVVETMGQPTPGPLRFCKVTAAALILASFEALLSSVGKEIPTVGLFKTWPAATFALSSCMKALRSGGH